MSRRVGGFTLLEVLIALIIAGLALGVMFKVAADALHASKLAARYQEATVRARSHLAMATQGGRLMPGDWNGEDGGGYHWRLHVAPMSGATIRTVGDRPEQISLYAVRVTESWKDDGHTREVQLNTTQIGQPPGAR